MDLLTTVLHELGHRLGYADDAVTGTPIDVLMTERLSTGVRRVPAVPAPQLSDADAGSLGSARAVPLGFTTLDFTTPTFTTNASPAPEHVALAAWTADADYAALALWADAETDAAANDLAFRAAPTYSDAKLKPLAPAERSTADDQAGYERFGE